MVTLEFTRFFAMFLLAMFLAKAGAAFAAYKYPNSNASAALAFFA